MCVRECVWVCVLIISEGAYNSVTVEQAQNVNNCSCCIGQSVRNLKAS